MRDGISAQHRAEHGLPEPADRRNPGDRYLRAEIDTNRKDEYRLVVKGIVALMVVAVLAIIREVIL